MLPPDSIDFSQDTAVSIILDIQSTFDIKNRKKGHVHSLVFRENLIWIQMNLLDWSAQVLFRGVESTLTKVFNLLHLREAYLVLSYLTSQCIDY